MNEQRYANEKEVALLTGRALSTLRNDRHYRRGIPYCKVGRSVRYWLPDVHDYMHRQRIDPEAEIIRTNKEVQ